MSQGGGWRRSLRSDSTGSPFLSSPATTHPALPAAFLFGTRKGGALEIGFRPTCRPNSSARCAAWIILFVAMPEFFRMIGRYAGLPARPERAGDERIGRHRPADDAAAVEGGETDA